MAKLDEEQLARLRELDREAFSFANEPLNAFFERAVPGGYSLDTTGFLAHPGYFQAPHSQAMNEADIVMLGSPLDLGAIGLAGTRHAPQAVREHSRNYGPMNDSSGHIPFDQCRIVDYGDVQWSATDLQTRLDDIYEVVLAAGQAGAMTLNCGGEHTTAFGCLRGLSEAHDDSFGVVHIDAHCDTMAAWGGDAVNDGSIFRQAALNGYIDPERTVQIGIRGRSGFLWEFSHDSGMTVITADEVYEKGTDWVLDKAREVVGDRRTYFSLDVDSLDSSVMMGTTGPEPFGLSPRQVRNIIHGCRGMDFVGADMVELNPNRDPSGSCAHLAAALFWELLCLLADARVAKSAAKPTLW